MNQDIKQTDQMPAIIETPQWSAPVDYESRNVVVLGGGVLGRRIGEKKYDDRT